MVKVAKSQSRVADAHLMHQSCPCYPCTWDFVDVPDDVEHHATGPLDKGPGVSSSRLPGR